MSKQMTVQIRLADEEKLELKKNALERGHQNVSAYLLYLWRSDRKKIKNNG